MILITGATGSIGTELVKFLAGNGVPLRAMVRDVKRADDLALPGVELVVGDFDKPETLRTALSGIERAFLLTNSSERAEAQQMDFVQAARESGVAHLVKLSQIHADKESPVRFLRYHAKVEAAIRESGMAHTFLRPNLFMQGLLAFSATIKNQNAFYAPIGNAKVSFVDIRDIAEVAAAALTQAGHEDKTYDLTGPQALSHAQAAAYFSEVLGRQINFVDVTPDAMRETLLGFRMPAWQADGLIEDYAHYRRGEAADIASGVQDAIGKAPRNFENFVRDYAPAFS